MTQNQDDGIYSQKDYFDKLNELTDSKELSIALAKFSGESSENNRLAVSSWFSKTELEITLSYDYPQSISDYWGKQVIRELMEMHCNGISFSHYDDYATTHPINGCQQFEREMEVKYIDGVDVFQEGIEAYKALTKKCENKDIVTLQDRNKTIVSKTSCLRDVTTLIPYLSFKTIL